MHNSTEKLFRKEEVIKNWLYFGWLMANPIKLLTAVIYEFLGGPL